MSKSNSASNGGGKLSEMIVNASKLLSEGACVKTHLSSSSRTQILNKFVQDDVMD